REPAGGYPGASCERVHLSGGRSVLLESGASEAELAALRALDGHPINPRRLLVEAGGAILMEDAVFQPLGRGATAGQFGALGDAVGALHRQFRGQEIGLPVHDAAWFSRAAPYVMAEVASLAEAGEYRLSYADSGRLEEAGVVIAELSEPLTGLLPTLVHGACDEAHAGFSERGPALVGWGLACSGLGWTDLARLSDAAAARGEESLLALVSSYAAAAGYEPALVADLVPFCRALSDLYRLDRWNRELSSGLREPGSLRDLATTRVHRLLDLVQV
ncbi:MAG TPA: hypothetical protein VNT60_01385, partial [Deinococcales bacterium]|nr:hypothetical protein [Deinococcales bacterium]